VSSEHDAGDTTGDFLLNSHVSFFFQMDDAMLINDRPSDLPLFLLCSSERMAVRQIRLELLPRAFNPDGKPKETKMWYC